MTTSSSPDRRLEETFQEIDPAAEAVARMEARILSAYEAEQRSLAREWLDLFRLGPVLDVRPVLNAGSALAAAAGLAMTSPLGPLLIKTLFG